MSGLRKLASETAIYGFSTILARLINYLLVPLYTAVFNPEAYGVVTYFYAILAFLNILLTYGMETTYFRFSSVPGEETRSYATALNSVLITSLVFLLLTWFQSDAIAGLIRMDEHVDLVQYCLLILVFDAAMALPFAWLRKTGRAKRFALLRTTNILLNVAFNLLFLYAGPQWVEAGWNPMGVLSSEPEVRYIFISNVLASGLTLLMLVPELRGLEYGFHFPLWKRMMVYTGPLVLVGFAGMINETLDRVLMKYLLPEAQADFDIGVYGACYKLSILMSLFIQAFRFAAEPFFFARAADQDRNIYARATHYFALFCFLIFLVVTLYLDIFKLFIRDESYHVGLHVVPILLLANLFLGLYYNLSIWYKLSDRTGFGAAIAVSGAALTLILLYLSLPFLGYTGAAWTTLIVYAGMTVAAYVSGQKYYPIPYKVRSFFFYLCFTLLLYLLGELAGRNLDQKTAYVLKSLLLAGFVVVVYLAEKPNKSLTSQQNSKP